MLDGQTARGGGEREESKKTREGKKKSTHVRWSWIDRRCGYNSFTIQNQITILL